MKRLELIEQLEAVQTNIETVEHQLTSVMPNYYEVFGKDSEWEHLIKIRVKALAYWKRKFNRILLNLGYKL